MKHIKYHLWILTLLVVVASCDLLGPIDDIEPQYKLTDDTVISDLKSAESTLNGVYASWNNVRIAWFRHYLNILTGSENEINIIGTNGFKDNNVLETNEGLEYNYDALYNVVNNASSFIYNLTANQNVKGLSEVRRAEMLSEARFSRALAYHYLLRQYGEFYHPESVYGIVLYGNEPIRDNVAMARSTVAASYKAIEDDLDDAILHAPEFSDHYKISRTTAKALKARILLYKKNYVQAASIAQEVIDESAAYGYSLEENFVTMFANTFNSSEGLFVLYTMRPNESDPDSNWRSGAGPTLTAIAGNVVNGELDSRYKQIYADIDPAATWIANNKYPYNSTTTMQNSYFFIRLAEMYYIKAESEARQQQWDAARTALKGILCLPRAGYTEAYVDGISTTGMLETILKHKWLELATENNEEWYDLVRYHVEDNFAIAPQYVASDAHLLMPIPRKAMSGNNLLEQNPSYEK